MIYTLQDITVHNAFGPRVLPAACTRHEGKPLLAYHREILNTAIKVVTYHPTMYAVTHVPTGYAACNNLPDLDHAKRLCTILMEKFYREFAAVTERFPTGMLHVSDFILDWRKANTPPTPP